MISGVRVKISFRIDSKYDLYRKSLSDDAQDFEQEYPRFLEQNVAFRDVISQIRAKRLRHGALEVIPISAQGRDLRPESLPEDTTFPLNRDDIKPWNIYAPLAFAINAKKEQIKRLEKLRADTIEELRQLQGKLRTRHLEIFSHIETSWEQGPLWVINGNKQYWETTLGNLLAESQNAGDSELSQQIEITLSKIRERSIYTFFKLLVWIVLFVVAVWFVITRL